MFANEDQIRKCSLGDYTLGIFFFFFFWPPCSIWSSQARDQIWATVVTRAAVTPDPLTLCPQPGIRTCILVLQSHHQSCCTTVGTSTLGFFFWGGVLIFITDIHYKALNHREHFSVIFVHTVWQMISKGERKTLNARVFLSNMTYHMKNPAIQAISE